jgi:hypothetical protein
VKARALNFRDLVTIMGQSPFPVQSGVIPMSDATGEVAAVGAGSFQRPSGIVKAFSTPSAAAVGVHGLTLPLGEYLTLLCVLAILGVWLLDSYGGNKRVQGRGSTT